MEELLTIFNDKKERKMQKEEYLEHIQEERKKYANNVNDLNNILLGYMIIYYRQMNFEMNEIVNYIDDFTEITYNNSPESAIEAYSKYKESLPKDTVFDNIVIPARFNQMIISELNYSDKTVIVRVCNALSRYNITILRDLHKKSKYELLKYRAFGKKCYGQLVIAIKRTIAQDSCLMKKIENDNKLMVSVTEIIRKLGVPANSKGHHYLREAIIFTVNNPNTTIQITKTIYPMIAHKFDTTDSSVEASIRRTIEKIWQNGNLTYIQLLLGDYIKDFTKKPSNVKIIGYIADYINSMI